MATRQFVVTFVTTSPMWTGTVRAVGCKHLISAERVFERWAAEVSDGDYSAVLLIDRDKRKVINSIGSKDPEKTARFFGY